MSELKKRLEKLKQPGMDSIAIVNLESSPDPNFFYFTNSDVNGIFYYDFRAPKIFTSELEHSRARLSWIKDVESAPFSSFSKIVAGKRVGINKRRISAEIMEKLKIKPVDISQKLESIREIKSDYEIKQLKQACSMASRLWPKIENIISPKLTEQDLKGIMEFMMNKQGCEPSFSAIVASGKNSRFPHHRPTKAKLKEPIVIDFGLRFNGYCSDITRTIGSSKQRMLEKIIEEAEDKIKSGTKASEADIFVRKRLGKEEKYFIHSLGHGIGIEVHEKPALSKHSTDIMKPGMTFTIEPGIYSNQGIRIENDYLLTEKGLVCLTK